MVSDTRKATMIGSEPMMPAEALASDDMAFTLAFIFLRLRNTRDRLLSASERLPPAWACTVMTTMKKLTSGSGTRS